MLRRLRYGEWVALISALALLGFLFLEWFVVVDDIGMTQPASVVVLPGDGTSGWYALGWLALMLCLGAILSGLLLPLVYAAAESSVLPMVAAIIATLVGGLAVIALLVQVILQPGDDTLTQVRSGWWLGLLAAAGVARGGFLSMRDEFVPGVALPDVPVRPAPQS